MKKRSGTAYVWENFNGQESDQCEQITRSQEKQINGKKMVQKHMGKTTSFSWLLVKIVEVLVLTF